MSRIPVILDTDIGGDIDDTWALVMLLNSPELDLRLVTTETADTVYRAGIVAKLLQIAGRTDVPVGIGIRQPGDGPRERQAAWVAGYDLASYPGTVHADGVAAMIDTILGSPEPVTLICIGPNPNIREALRRSPQIARRARFVGMLGSLDRQHDGKSGAIAEWNVVQDIPAAQAALGADWDATITPLDTCGVVRLEGARYKAFRSARGKLVEALQENYRLWLLASGRPQDQDLWETGSSILYDTVAVHLAHSTEFLDMRRLAVRVTDEGFTARDDRGKAMNVAMQWTDLEAYKDYLLARIVAR